MGINMLNVAYIVAVKRSAICNFMGNFSSLSAVKLGSMVIQSLLKESKIDGSFLSEVIIGQVLTGGLGQNVARQSSIKAGIPKEIPAFSVNKVCGSGLKAIELAAQSIISGNADLIIAGGQESMSTAMHAALVRSGVRFGDSRLVDMMLYDGLTDAFSSNLMGITAENIANQFNISREDQDMFAYESQQKAIKAQATGAFDYEINPIKVILQKKEVIIDKDEFIKHDVSLEKLSKMKPAFKTNGSVTAGNSSGINDGAAFVVIASEAAIKKYNLTPIAKIISCASGGVDPNIMGTGPIPAVKLALKRANWQINDLDLVESNEAFAVQSICVNRELGWNTEIVNVNGGALALGHPIGASGARIVVTLLSELQKRKQANKALASLCIGGGMGIAMCFEKC